MILRQFLHAEPVAASYLLGCADKPSGAVVDPVGDLGRTERASNAEDGARALFQSVKALKALSVGCIRCVAPVCSHDTADGNCFTAFCCSKKTGIVVRNR